VTFPDGFLWGAATSSYQIEGSPLADGAGPSNWHRFTHTPGRVADGSNGDVACDHYRRWAADVELMRSLDLSAYRFSIAWSRVLPAGRGRPNRAGLDFYARLVDRLLERGIQPCVTLYHWDHPAALDDLGGWANPEMADRFAEYARTVFRALGDRVPMFATLNEPWVVADAGYLHGVHPPGRREPSEVPRVSHQLLRAHAAAVRAYRAEANRRIGLVVNLEPKYPASDSPEDLAAVRRADAYMNRQYLDPVLLGRWPEELGGIFGDSWPGFDDLESLREPIDFLGVNYYTRAVVRHDDAAFARARSVRQTGLHTETGWEVHPESFGAVLRWVRDRYGRIPIYVTENGAAFPDPVAADGRIEDPLRVDYLRRHLDVLRGVIADGVDVRGYFAWSLLDNFEWAQGFTKRFGLVHVDYGTQARTLKDSARFYAEVIRSHGASLTAG
jgi:beta-glucosidase